MTENDTNDDNYGFRGLNAQSSVKTVTVTVTVCN